MNKYDREIPVMITRIEENEITEGVIFEGKNALYFKLDIFTPSVLFTLTDEEYNLKIALIKGTEQIPTKTDYISDEDQPRPHYLFLGEEKPLFIDTNAKGVPASMRGLIVLGKGFRDKALNG